MNPKKKVLFLLEAFDKGGIEKVTLDIVNNLDPEKYDITVQTFWYGGHCQNQVKEHVKVIPFFFRRYVRGIIRLIEYLPPKMLYRLFVHGKYDIEIACSDGGAAKVISGSTNPKSRKICWVHMDVVERGSQLKEFRNAESARPIYEKFDRIACVSRYGLERFILKFGRYRDMCAIHNPIPDEMIRKNAKISTHRHSDVLEYVTVGRLAVEKGFDRLILAGERLKQEKMQFRIRIIGDGTECAKLKRLIKEKQMEEYVLLEGYYANPYPFIASSDWYICSSLDEGHPLSVGEALCLGIPVLGTDCTGVREWLDDGKFGIIMENSTEGIYWGLKKTLQMSAEEYIEWQQVAKDKAEDIRFEKQFALWQKCMLEK